MIEPGFHWYVVQAQPSSEAKAVAHLNRQGFVTYLPRHLKKRRHARKVEMVGAPLFPRYLFVSMDLTVQRWRCIQSTFGVSRLICNGEMPAPIAASVIDGLKAQEDDHGFLTLSQRPRFNPGDKVVVLDGVFSSSLGIYEGSSDEERISILLDMLGRKVRVVLDAVCVELA